MRPLLTITAMALPAVALAAPTQLDHQGRLLDASGGPITGARTLTVSLHDDATAGTELFTETFSVNVGDGYFAVVLGTDTDANPLDDAIFANEEVWVGIQVDSAELGARSRVRSVPFASRATSVAGGVVDASEVRIGGQLVIDGTGAFRGGPTLDGLGCGPGQLALFSGSAWSCVTAPANLSTLGGATVLVATDLNPDSVSVAPVIEAAPGVRTTSAAIAPAGFEGTLVASVAGPGEPLLRVNGGAWVPATAIEAGNTVELQVTAPTTATEQFTSLVLGTTVVQWSVTATQPFPTCASLLAAHPDLDNGDYWIDPDGESGERPFIAWCDMQGGGWTWKAQDVPFHIGFTGGPVVLSTPVVPTEYAFDVYGAAAGGSADGVRGGHGGSASGHKTFDTSTDLWVYAGGQGDSGGDTDGQGCQTRKGGYNGGGRGTQGGGGGGGGTDIRTAPNDLSTRLIVGGGGGGCGYGGSTCTTRGGDGGGLTGESGPSSPSGAGGRGGTQSARGTSPHISGSANPHPHGYFGVGGDAQQCNDEGGGGGGWYRGAAGGIANTTGGGGSSYHGGMDSDVAATRGGNAGAGFVEYTFR